MSSGPSKAISPAAPPGYWSDVWRRYAKNRVAFVALLYVLSLVLVAVFSPLIVGAKPIVCKYKGHLYFPCLGYFNEAWENPVFYRDKFRNEYPENLKRNDPESWAIWPLVFQDPLRRIRPNEWAGHPGNPVGIDGFPNRYNLLGTTVTGSDVFAQLIHGSRRALLVGFVSMGLAAAIGITLGALAGYFGGWIDTLLSRLLEIVLCLPTLVLILSLTAIIQNPNVWHIMAIIGVTGWPGIARLTRAEFLKFRNIDFVVAARSLGASEMRIMLRHILPNSLAPILVPITFGVASAILVENALQFLGLGDTNTASWGALLNEGQRNQNMWWLIVFPGAAIFLAVLAYNLIGEGLQEATDPRLRESQK